MKRVLIGRITTAHGVRGDVKVQYFLENVDLLFSDAGVYTSDTKPERVVLTYKNDLKGDVVVCSVSGISDRNAAERLRGTQLYLDEQDLPPPDAGMVYLRELEGLEAVTPEGKALGTVLGVRNFGASDLLEIKGKKENYYIPFCEPFLVRVEREAKRVILNEPEVL